jgi:hypothetical protein
MKSYPRILSIAALTIGVGIAIPEHAEAAVFDINWTGSSGYTLTGQLTFADSLLGTGVINESQIQNLSIDVFLNGVSQGTASLASFNSSVAFNLNFNTTTEQFVVGGRSDGPSGQLWNFNSPTSVGSASENITQVVTVGGMAFGSINVGASTLSATPVPTATPLPAALPLFATGLGGLGLPGWRRKRKARAGVA